MVKWFCSSALCCNNFSTRDKNNAPMKYYRLPRNKETPIQYGKILQTSGINWEKGHICAAHWSSGERKNALDIPDVPVPSVQYDKLNM